MISLSPILTVQWLRCLQIGRVHFPNFIRSVISSLVNKVAYLISLKLVVQWLRRWNVLPCCITTARWPKEKVQQHSAPQQWDLEHGLASHFERLPVPRKSQAQSQPAANRKWVTYSLLCNGS